MEYLGRGGGQCATERSYNDLGGRWAGEQWCFWWDLWCPLMHSSLSVIHTPMVEICWWQGQPKRQLATLMTIWWRSCDDLGNHWWRSCDDPSDNPKMTLMTQMTTGDYLVTIFWQFVDNPEKINEDIWWHLTPNWWLLSLKSKAACLAGPDDICSGLHKKYHLSSWY